MAPKLVTPYRMSGKRGKNDAADAAAICEAVQRPNMRFVPVKTEEQQSRLMVHRARQGYVAARTACINRIRGLLSEFGIVLPQKAEVVRAPSPRAPGRPAGLRQPGDRRPAQRSAATWTSASSSTTCICEPWPRTCTAAQQLMQLMGVGETTATAIVAMVGNGREFDSGRQFAAWLGLVPGQYSSGGKARLGRITKAGDAYLRSLLVLGARAVLNAAADQDRQPEPLGHRACASGAATGRRWWRSRRRTRAWPGRCSPRASRSSCRPEGALGDEAPTPNHHPRLPPAEKPTT